MNAFSANRNDSAPSLRGNLDHAILPRIMALVRRIISRLRSWAVERTAFPSHVYAEPRRGLALGECSFYHRFSEMPAGVLYDGNGRNAVAEFLPGDFTAHGGVTWWLVSPAVYRRYLEIRGFAVGPITYREFRHRDGPVRLFQIVARRI